MKKELKGFITGVVTTAFIFAAVFTVFAEPVEKAINAVYNNIKLYVDGKLVKPKDAKGNDVDPFIYNGTTYLPIRAVSEALGKTVSWDGETNSVYVGNKPEQEANETKEVKDAKEVTVGTSEELVKEIGSNKKILLKPGIYNLSKIKQTYSEDKHVFWQKVLDGNELVVKDVFNLTIEGIGEEPSQILIEPRYAYVLSFINAENIKINNIKAGHTEEGTCSGGVYRFINSADIEINKSELYGCGTEGLNIEGVEKLTFADSKIYDCTYNIMTVKNCKDIKFINSSFVENREFDLINVDNSGNILFDKCSITNNYTAYEPIYDFFDYSLFNVNLSKNVIVRDSKINKNKCVYLAKDKDSVVFENTDISGNTFYKGEYFK
ncbi:MAG TPA: stalk domain-containing protein [Pseudobacteroides sp.]|nr:stalk domain-containing protein [Pseudobacteroides sp.]